MNINYENEVQYFYDWLETNELGTSCIVLWHALMHTYRKAGYPNTFAVAISVLEIKTGLKKAAIQRARNVLKQAGVIDWYERKGNQSSIYKINSFAALKEPQSVPQTIPQSVSQGVPQCEPIINNNNNDNINIKDYVVNNNNGVFKEPQCVPQCVSQGVPQNLKNIKSYFENKCGLMSTTAFLELSEFLGAGMEEGLISGAIDRAIDNGVYKWSYIKKILDSCIMSEIKTLEQFLAKERRFRDDSHSGRYTKSSVEGEHNPNNGENEGERLGGIARKYSEISDTSCDF